MTSRGEPGPAITIDDVAKRFRLVEDRQSSIKAMAVNRSRRSRHTELWALDGVSAEIEPATAVGLVGHNGSGKSTLLKCISNILRPDRGSIHVEGRLASLLELGAGFHPELSGRENVYLNGSILGLRRADIDARFDQIVAFSGLDRFIDSPVRNYSSGMFVRLGFAVAINLAPDVLLVDEILAVGDEEFQRRCLAEFDRLRSEGCTVVVVSHNLGLVRSFCDTALWLDGGQLRGHGPASEIVDRYLRSVDDDAGPPPESGIISSVELLDGSGGPIEATTPGAGVRIRVRWDPRRLDDTAQLALGIYAGGIRLAGINTSGTAGLDAARASGQLDLSVPSLPLAPGSYRLAVALHDETMRLVHERLDPAMVIRVEGGAGGAAAGHLHLGGTWN